MKFVALKNVRMIIIAMSACAPPAEPVVVSYTAIKAKLVASMTSELRAWGV